MRFPFLCGSFQWMGIRATLGTALLLSRSRRRNHQDHLGSWRHARLQEHRLSAPCSAPTAPQKRYLRHPRFGTIPIQIERSCCKALSLCYDGWSNRTILVCVLVSGLRCPMSVRVSGFNCSCFDCHDSRLCASRFLESLRAIASAFAVLVPEA